MPELVVEELVTENYQAPIQEKEALTEEGSEKKGKVQ